MDLRQLNYFMHVAKLGGFNRASAHLHIAQSALSRTIGQLEQELGVSLLVRTARGVKLTSGGQLLLSNTDMLLRHIRQVKDEVVAEATVPRGEIVIGMPPSLQSMLIVPLLREMRTQCPKVFVTAWVATSVVLKEQLLNGKLDIALLGIMDSDTSLECQPLFFDDMFLVGPPNALPVNAKYVSWSRIACCPLILTSPPNSVRLLVEAAAAKNSQELNVVMEVNYVPVLIDLVRSGIGYTLLPYSAIHELIAAGYVSATKIRDLAYNWVIATAKEKQLSTAGRYARDGLMRLTTVRLMQERWPNAKLACKLVKVPAVSAKQTPARSR